MPLLPCRECGEKVSSKARVCPKCGVKKPVVPKRFPKKYIFLFILIFVIWGSIIENSPQQKALEAAQKQQEEKENQIYMDKMRAAASQMNAALAAIPPEPNWQSLKLTSIGQKDYQFTLTYKGWADVLHAKIDTGRVAHAVLAELMREGRKPYDENIMVSVFAHEDDLRGETGTPLKIDLGATYYSYVDDQLEFDPPKN